MIADVIGLHAPGLNHADAAQTTLSLVTTARRFALTVERTAATDDTTLEELIGACNDFRRLAARSPTPTRRTEWLHRPFALSAFDAEALPAAERCQESVAGLVDYLYMHSRNPLTSRQILAVSRVAEVIATRLETLAEEPGSQNAAGWGRLRRQLLLVSDGHADHAQFGNARLMQHAADAHRAIEQVDTHDLTSPAIQAVAASLPMIATRLQRELRTATQTDTIQQILRQCSTGKPVRPRAAGQLVWRLSRWRKDGAGSRMDVGARGPGRSVQERPGTVCSLMNLSTACSGWPRRREPAGLRRWRWLLRGANAYCSAIRSAGCDHYSDRQLKGRADVCGDDGVDPTRRRTPQWLSMIM